MWAGLSVLLRTAGKARVSCCLAQGRARACPLPQRAASGRARALSTQSWLPLKATLISYSPGASENLLRVLLTVVFGYKAAS